MKKVINYAPPYSLFFLTGSDTLDSPDCEESIGWIANRDLPPNTFPDP